MTVERLTDDEIAAGMRVKLCADGRVRLARVGMFGEGDEATAALGWYLPRTKSDRFEANKFRKESALHAQADWA